MPDCGNGARKKADETGVPLYTIFTNEQLAQIAAQRISSNTGLREIDGIGEARIKKYGDSVIQIMRGMTVEERQQDETGS
ncbi:MAG: HRDC domain-containing protein [Proteobacteria bacterium]|nr:HRDC domain-containing protein [Pseudomonadota bacterium]MBU4297501.1 HRDC domain-containing protein [Pseudomonadota bacterium]MCG2749719.1 HRDC domain-containing protein [Desulfobulbaceae bacterium]